MSASTNTDPVDDLRKRCNIEVGPISEKAIDEELFSILNSMGMVTCMEADGDLYLIEQLAKQYRLTDAQIEQLKHGSIGCEPLRVVAKQSIRSKEVIGCMLEEYTTDLSVGGTLFQSTDICSEGKMCCNLHITQKGIVKVLDQHSVPEDTIIAIGQQIRDDITEAFSEASKDMDDPDAAEKFVESITEKISDREAITQQNKMNTSIVTHAFTSQGICLRLARGACLVSNNNCEIKQEGSIRLLAQNIVGNNLNDILGLPGVGNFFEDFVPPPSIPQEQQDNANLTTIKKILKPLVIVTSAFLGLTAVYWIIYRAVVKKPGLNTIGHGVGIILLLATAIAVGYFGWEFIQNMQLPVNSSEGPQQASKALATDRPEVPDCCICRQKNGEPVAGCALHGQSLVRRFNKQRALTSQSKAAKQSRLSRNLALMKNAPLYRNYNQASPTMKNYQGSVCGPCLG